LKHRVKSAARYAALGAALAAGAAQTTASSEAAHARAGTRTAVAASDSAAAPLWMEMRNVDLHVDERRVMHMRSLHGELVPAAPISKRRKMLVRTMFSTLPLVLPKTSRR